MQGNKNSSIFFVTLVAIGAYVQLAISTCRYESDALIFNYVLVFLAYLFLLYKKPEGKDFKLLIAFSFIIRILFVFSTPSLSDDIYRFVWDGRLLNAGIHPFSNIPSFYLIPGNEVAGLTPELFSKLNSPEYYTIYPPFAQFIYWLSTLFTDSIYLSGVIMKSLILLAEAGTIFIGIQLLERYRLPKNRILIYTLNPLVIIELTGNLHFEALMIFFLFLSVYLLHTNSIVKSAFFMAMSIASKLLPIMLLPLFLRKLKIRSLMKWYVFIGLFVLLITLPLINSELLAGMTESIGLYFQKFEFNASFYYLIREVGFWVKGYNIIESVGPFLALCTFSSIMILSLYHKKQLTVFELFMWALTIYFLLSTTVHPWYITTIVACSIFTNYRYSVIWSFLIFLTYLGYNETGYQENLLIIIVEYTVVITVLIYELYEVSKSKIPWFAKHI